MKLTTKGRFAVSAMADLAIQYELNPVCPTPLVGVSQRQKISLSYLEQLFGKLRRAALVESTRGPGGGYSLAREPSRISVAEIILAVDESVDATQCGETANCTGTGQPCITHRVWHGLNETVSNYLNSINLKTIVDWQPERHQVDFPYAKPVRSAFTPLPVGHEVDVLLGPNSLFSLHAISSEASSCVDEVSTVSYPADQFELVERKKTKAK